MYVCAQTGKWVLSGGEDGSVRVWAPKTGMCKAAFDGAVGHDATVTCVAGSVEGHSLTQKEGVEPN
jgi:WD40 repeat protein